MLKTKYITILTIALLALTSCGSHHKIAYLQDVPQTYAENISRAPNVTIKNGDWLSIVVNSRDPDITRMLNLPMLNQAIGSSSNVSGNRITGYMVDDNGYIDFPQYGLIRAKDMNLIQLGEFIKNGLNERGIATDAVVTVQFLNYDVSVTGEVNHPGTYNSPTGRITVLDAISKAGDMTVYGKRDNVMVIREEDGVRSVGRLDLRSRDIFDSPFYYLHQNDVVYVEPNNAKAGQGEINQNRSIGTIASITSVLISLAVLIFK